MIEEAKRQNAAGSIIYFCWHMLRPTEDEPGQPGANWGGSVQSKLTDERLQPGAGNALKAIYDDPYYIKRGDPMPK